MNTDLEITLEFLDSPTEVEFYAVAGAPGQDGQDGAPGRDGADGHTPVITASKVGKTTTISVDGDPVAQILDGDTGAKGDKGDKGDPGQDGAKGDKGDTGAKGDKGDTGAQGIQGIQGEKGDTGAKGDKGDKGDTGATGAAGQDGYTPIRGTDYWTAADKAEIVSDVVDEVGTKAETVTGSTPSITAQANHRYICGTVSSISFTPCASGICDVIFTSGSTPAVLTMPNTIKLPAWFSAGTLDADTTYEINILDGVYGVVMAWV